MQNILLIYSASYNSSIRLEYDFRVFLLSEPNQCKVVISASNVLISVITPVAKKQKLRIMSSSSCVMLFKYPQSSVMANRFFGDSFTIFEIEKQIVIKMRMNHARECLCVT